MASGVAATVVLAGERGWVEDDSLAATDRVGLAALAQLTSVAPESCVAALEAADRMARSADVIFSGALLVRDDERLYGLAIGRVEIIELGVVRRPEPALVLENGTSIPGEAIGAGRDQPRGITVSWEGVDTVAIHATAVLADTPIVVAQGSVPR